MNNNQRYSDFMATMRSALGGLKSIVWTSMPGVIIDFDPSAVTATVQIAITGMVNSEDKVTATPYPLLVDIPVVFPPRRWMHADLFVDGRGRMSGIFCLAGNRRLVAVGSRPATKQPA